MCPTNSPAPPITFPIVSILTSTPLQHPLQVSLHQWHPPSSPFWPPPLSHIPYRCVIYSPDTPVTYHFISILTSIPLPYSLQVSFIHLIHLWRTTSSPFSPSSLSHIPYKCVTHHQLHWWHHWWPRPSPPWPPPTSWHPLTGVLFIHPLCRAITLITTPTWLSKWVCNLLTSYTCNMHLCPDSAVDSSLVTGHQPDRHKWHSPWHCCWLTSCAATSTWLTPLPDNSYKCLH